LTVNYVGHVETYEQNLSEICEKISVRKPFRRAKPINVSRFDPDRNALTLSSRALDVIRARYAADFELLGYSLDPGEPPANLPPLISR
jgi:hypothetical protein